MPVWDISDYVSKKKSMKLEEGYIFINNVRISGIHKNSYIGTFKAGTQEKRELMKVIHLSKKGKLLDLAKKMSKKYGK